MGPNPITVAILAVTALAAQPTVVVSGKITDASNGLPVTGASIILFSGEVMMPQVTDSGGNYRIEGVPPKPAILRVEAKGFLDASPTAIHAAADSVVQNIALTPVSSITGRLKTEEGLAVPASISLILYREDYTEGVRQWTAGGNTSTVQNDGSFKIDDLTTGQYILSAGPPMGGLSMFTGARISGAMGTIPASTGPNEGYVQTYYPGATDFNAAIPITLLEGESITADFVIAKHRLYRISGELPSGREPFQGAIRVSSPGDGVTQHTYGGSSSDSGKFSVEGLPPGSYILLSMNSSVVQSGSGMQFAIRTIPLSLPIIITDHDIDDLRPALVPPIAPLSIEGTFKMANGSSLPANLAVLYGYPKPGLQTDSIPTAPNGEFFLDGPPGDYSVRPVVPPSYAVTEIRYAGGNYLNSFIPFSADAVDQSLMIVLSDQPGSVSGSLIDDHQKPIAAKVILAPDPLPPRFDFHALRVASTNSDGSFSLSGLTPGRYKAAVLTGDDRKRDHDLTILNDKFRVADTFELTAGQNLAIVPKQ